MKFVEVFPYKGKRYNSVIYFFETCIKGQFPKIIDEYADGFLHRFDSCGLILPSGEDNIMRKGPFAWSGCPYIHMEPDDYDELDFKEFIVCFYLAARVYLINNPNCREKEQIYDALKRLRRNYTDINWIIDHFYGEDEYVCDEQCILTGEVHGKEWGEKWYNSYGKYLCFDDIDELVEAELKKYIDKQSENDTSSRNETQSKNIIDWVSKLLHM